jgi:hypothetical protein
LAKTAAERQAAFRARHGTQVSVTVSPQAREALDNKAHSWGVSQREALDRILTDRAPQMVSGEVLALRRHVADLERAYTTERAERLRVEAYNTVVLKRAISAENALYERDAAVTGKKRR